MKYKLWVRTGYKKSFEWEPQIEISDFGIETNAEKFVT